MVLSILIGHNVDSCSNVLSNYVRLFSIIIYYITIQIIERAENLLVRGLPESFFSRGFSPLAEHNSRDIQQ